MEFKLTTKLTPKGDQPSAIREIVEGIKKGERFITLLGVTGSGKTFTMASVINEIKRPALVISPNKTLAAQLYREFKGFFPQNQVEFFVSYYDYYRPEAYIPSKDVYIEKEADINEEIERMRLSAMKSVITRKDVIVVASVSCIYASGDPKDFREINLSVKKGEKLERRYLLKRLAAMQYKRSDSEIEPGTFRIHGEILEIHPPYDVNTVRVEFFDDEVERILVLDPVTRKTVEQLDRMIFYPAREFTTDQRNLEMAAKSIREELNVRLKEFESQGKVLEAERLRQRTLYDIEMIQTMGYCNGIENYSRHFSGKKPGEPPWTLMDYFDKDLIVFIDESHITVPQLMGMVRGDRSRKESLVEYGFRLPSAFDNRPLKFEEFLERAPQIVFVSATPGPYERERSSRIVEQIVRPTGLVDPEVIIKPTINQIDDLMNEMEIVKNRNERALIVTLTKEMSEKLSAYLVEMGYRSEFLHSDLDTIERMKVLTRLRKGEIDAIVGVNLLREGLDLPEVSLVAILDADKEGFLRSTTSLIQTMGRASRNVNGKIILYADTVTDSMKMAINEAKRRRQKQIAYNIEHNLKPETIQKEIDEFFMGLQKEEKTYENIGEDVKSVLVLKEKLGTDEYIEVLSQKMREAAEDWRFEEAAFYRDEIKRVKNGK
ncbi:MAG: excinuclease ABC subunit B [Mesoaciditoga sp.]|uniref:excinuclease ABC subunit UvrB n=1 Tax=Athalassotoga sp. TaxID=2022597 RepID=UPI000CB6A963|nr:MAG: excinuclease ABC subunit B [Mesoaciditoga sp.]PMP78708.1 MAG: excinuclease ABC subunit B [Mesoaciditoga sp.]HEU24297.1 excinuclease ABC subunit UvrB [Mesoaciditoga lauensis]